MAGPFGKQTAPSNRPKRNTFDLSHQNNLTMEFGKLYPFLCEPVIPGDSVRLDTAFGIRAMPTAFPLQTKIRADVHYFYVRNRNLWKDWPDFIGQTRDDLVMPYVTNDSIPLSNGSLSDYLNIPTSFTSQFKRLNSFSLSSGSSVPDYHLNFIRSGSSPSFSYSPSSFYLSNVLVSPIDSSLSSFNLRPSAFGGFDVSDLPSDTVSFELHISSSNISEAIARSLVFYVCFTENNNLLSIPNIESVTSVLPATPLSFRFSGRTPGGDFVFSPVFLDPLLGSVDSVTSLDGRTFSPASWLSYVTDSSECCLCCIQVPELYSNSDSLPPYQSYDFQSSLSSISLIANLFYSTSVVDEAGSSDVFSSLRLNALPFRAYESIYNAFYRDDRNNPYILDGQKVYNKYLPTQDGGLDENRYILHSRNWEQDFLTTAVDSPQQGIAPLVGISSTGVASFALDDGSVEKVQLKVGDDGDTIVGAEYSNNLSPSVARQLVNVATSGISINDFRGVNALQRWLEINIRRGLKYKDQIESHFGVTPSYAELDMPEFLGGATQWFDSSQVNQTSEASSGSPLGSYAGQLSLVGGSNHPVTRFFDEHGYIIGIISISPVPVYINTLHADFLKSSPLDYYFPEFAHLGYQPIPFSQVGPLERLANGYSLSDTFGYQRAWYEYMSRTDEAHGDFRGDLRDFLLMRRFRFAPSLSEDFLLVNQKQLNQVFTVNEINGKPVMPFLGQIHIKEIFKRPIPRYQISTLE